MSREVKSQWVFGELFATEETRKVFSVSEITGRIRRLLEEQVGSIWISGEVSNFRLQSSGHVYFTLKDAEAQLSCVLFRREPVAHRALLQDGQHVLLQGDVTVYDARGQYQMIVRAVELRGVGALQIAFEKLKEKLAAEGLFAQERKRPLPKYPQRIGLVTSPTGAAIRDVLHVIHRRNPCLEIILAPCRVQGEGVGVEVAAAIRMLNRYKSESRNPKAEIDLILVTRGGGSLEDLWAFNEEVVARAIFESIIPVVSAVGHEIDFTIADFVADVRAATPSAAAEIITEGVFASRSFVIGVISRMQLRVSRRVTDSREDFELLRNRLERVHPRRRVEDQSQRLDDLKSVLLRSLMRALRDRRGAWQNTCDRLNRLKPGRVVQRRRDAFSQVAGLLDERFRYRTTALRSRLGSAARRLRLLGPEEVLARGYSITTDVESGEVLRDAKAVRAGQQIKTRLTSGEIVSRVEH